MTTCVAGVACWCQGQPCGPCSQKLGLFGGSLRTGSQADFRFGHLRLKWLSRWSLMKASKDAYSESSLNLLDGFLEQ